MATCRFQYPVIVYVDADMRAHLLHVKVTRKTPMAVQMREAMQEKIDAQKKGTRKR